MSDATKLSTILGFTSNRSSCRQKMEQPILRATEMAHLAFRRASSSLSPDEMRSGLQLLGATAATSLHMKTPLLMLESLNEVIFRADAATLPLAQARISASSIFLPPPSRD